MTAGSLRSGYRLVEVCPVADLEDKIPQSMIVGPRAVCALRLRDRVYLFNDRCPHRGGKFSSGKLTYRLDSDCAGRIVVDRTQPTIACPWHGWEFGLGDGRLIADGRIAMKVYDTEIHDGQVYMRVPATST